jgi:chromate transporter
MTEVSFPKTVKTWARVAALSFGGPAGQIATMHRIIVEEKCWIDEAHFLHALSFCTLLPGPEAQQLAIYLGWLTHRTRGGIAAGMLFVLPGLVSLMALSMIYASCGRIGTVAALFFGIKAAVLAVVLQAVHRVGSRVLKSRGLIAIAAAAFAAIFCLAVPFPVIILAAGFLGSTLLRPSAEHTTPTNDPHQSLKQSARTAGFWLTVWLAPVAVLILHPIGELAQIGVFFSKMAVISFGGAYAVLAYVAQQAVEHHHWLTPGEMLDGLGLAETTPGPLIMVNQFVGFLAAYRHPGSLAPMLAGVLGGLLTTWVTFAPCFLWVFLGAPYVETLRGNGALTGALTAITASVVGVMLNLAVWFALHCWFSQTVAVHAWGLHFDAPLPASLDPWALAISAAAIVAVFRFKAGMLATLFAAAAAGVSLHLAGAL